MRDSFFIIFFIEYSEKKNSWGMQKPGNGCTIF